MSGRWIFLIVILLSYSVLLFFDFGLTQDALRESYHLLRKIAPAFVLVFVLMFLSNLLLDPKKIAKFFGRNTGWKGWLISVGGGIVSAGPIYLWYPLLSDFKAKGMRNAFIAAFLYNRAVKIPLLPMMICYFGLLYVVIMTFYMILFSVINGILVDKFVKMKK